MAALGGKPEEVCALYERAVEADPNHAGALFGLALENDRRGNDDTALDLYQRAAARYPSHVGSLINLGLLYEDRDEFDRAQKCYQRVLDSYPDHRRARLFLLDAQASGDMYYDEEAQKKRDRLSQVLGIPVSDFELSVRSRNCLQKMGIATLGDLTRCTRTGTAGEQELWRDLADRDSRDAAFQGFGAGSVCPREIRARTDRRTTSTCRRTSRRCWNARSRI